MTVRLKPLAEQVVVITGASSGIGLVTARRAAAAGAKVLLVARNEAALRAAVETIVAAGGAADFAVADVDERAAVEAAATKAVERFGRIDTWVNNAGVTIYALLVDTPEEVHRRMMRTNYFGAVNGCLTAIPHLREAGGALITVSSIAADIPSPIMGAYAATKHATRAYVESLRIELLAAKLPISLSLVKPSGIDTPVGEHALNLLDGEARIPPLVYDPELVARAILDCAVRPRRTITVGGAGRLQTLFAAHFPAVFERIAPLMMPLLTDRDVPKTPTDALAQPAADGHERSAINPGRRWSVYTEAMLRPRVAAGATAIVVAVAGAAVWAAFRKPSLA